jgi:PAS domain S-box-containing protein
MSQCDGDFRTLADELPMLVWIQNAAGEVEWGNRACIEFMGMPLEEMDGRQWLARLHPEDLGRFAAARERALATGDPLEVEYRVRDADNEYRWMTSSARPLLDAKGNIIQWLGVSIDIDDRRREATLLDNLFSTAPIGFAFFDSDFRMIRANEMIAAMGSRPAAELIGRSIAEINPDFWSASEPALRRALVGEDVVNVEREANAPDGPHTFLLSYYPTRQDGDVIGVGVIAIDVTGPKAAADRENKLAEELGRARQLEGVGQLAGGIAHDFNNILGVIINCATFADESLEEDSQAHRDIGEIRQAAERAAGLIKQLLVFSQREVVVPEVLDLGSLAGGLENLLDRALGEHVELTMNFAPDLWRVEADPGQLEQILVNLAVNARDAMPEGGRVLIEGANVELGDEYLSAHPKAEAGNYVRLTVSDTGAGMSKDVLERAFEPFFTTKADKGTGLGLASVYGIVTGMKGRIDIYSEIGIGTTFKIHLLPTSARPAAQVTAAKAPRGGAGEVVLLVEDEPDVRRMTERILDIGGYAVLSAATPEEALGFCKDPDQAIDLLLTDIVMPGVLGTQLADQVRAICPELRVIFMSGYTQGVIDTEALSHSSAVFIEKPFNVESLLRVVGERFNDRNEDGD